MAVGAIGEVVIKSPTLTKGYCNLPKLNQQAFKDGAFFTGDLGKLDAAGRLYITGRKKILIDTGGRKVDPIEIEDILVTHPKVKEAVVVGVKELYSGEIVKAVIVPNEPEGFRDHEIFSYCKERLAEFKVPKIVEFRKDSRQFIIVGPCSLHDPKAALEYAEKLKVLANKVEDKLLIVMRVYFEKPRTTVGWKGLINDPDIDGSFNVQKGLLTARQLLIKIAEIGLPAATESLDPVTPQYLSELVSWTAIGARTIESQTHREMASGLSMPVGFKNSTDGNIQVALDAIQAAITPHHFLGMNQVGQISIFQTKGNANSHVILRGGGQPNFDAATVTWVEKKLEELKLPQRIVIDCSHGNSYKKHNLQTAVFNKLAVKKLTMISIFLTWD